MIRRELKSCNSEWMRKEIEQREIRIKFFLYVNILKLIE